MKNLRFSGAFSTIAVVVSFGSGVVLAQPAFRMGVGLSDSSDSVPSRSTAYSSLVGSGGPLTVGYYYQGKEVGAVLPLSLSGTTANNFLSSLGVEIYLVNPVSGLLVDFSLYDVGVGGVPTGGPFYSVPLVVPGTLAPGAHELPVDQIPALDGLFDLNGKSQVAFTVSFPGFNLGDGGLSLAGPVGEAIERDVIPGGAPNGEFFTIAVAIPETSTVAGGAFLALACCGLYFKRRLP